MLQGLRRYEVQARYALALALLSAVPGAAALVLGVTRFDAMLGRIVYGSQGRFVPAFVGCVALSMIPAGLAFVLGLSSAGQRRNDRSGQSWIGFFLGGTVLSLDLIVLIAFYMLRLERPL